MHLLACFYYFLVSHENSQNKKIFKAVICAGKIWKKTHVKKQYISALIFLFNKIKFM